MKVHVVQDQSPAVDAFGVHAGAQVEETAAVDEDVKVAVVEELSSDIDVGSPSGEAPPSCYGASRCHMRLGQIHSQNGDDLGHIRARKRCRC